ncbi:FtsH protease activity modulator HflK [Kiloniella laminariae]|uniref:Protein HflK n=1 Tax=Kiloniella laminariae TaxID=454162 RepID=A0ABT4LI27_9PROT|nr:FtsH protease activity modulator HflK [Kiloniella laminariae]MCZ4280759.1 FtsH protease activity modulator HflK [Kiloniella laminariae]
MPWENKGSGGGGPWGSGSGGGGGHRPPDIEDMIRKSQDRMKEMIPGGGNFSGKGFIFILAVVLLFWLGSGFYRVQPNEQGIVLRFGQWTNTTEAGLNWHLPYPIETVMTPEVTTIHQINIGFSSSNTGGRLTKRDVPEESLMLTGDQNIIDIDLTLQWKIAEPGKFLFNIRDQEATVKIAAESALREIIGQTDIQPALTEARDSIQTKTQVLLQSILDQYEAGILITEVQLQNVQPPEAVIDAFDDVQRSLQDRDRARNEADRYRNDILPRARGEAQKQIQEAEAYKERLLNEATGEADRFLSVYKEYKQNPEVTKRRMYLETMQKVFQNTDKVILGTGENNVLPYLPLNELRKNSQ